MMVENIYGVFPDKTEWTVHVADRLKAGGYCLWQRVKASNIKNLGGMNT